MAKQTASIEVDVPEGFEVVAYRPFVFGEWYLHQTGPRKGEGCSIYPWLILRKVEPVRESRWGWICCVSTSLDDALANSMDYSGPLVRADYEDGKCVFVGIENARPVSASVEEA